MTSTQFSGGGAPHGPWPGTPENSPLVEKPPLWDVLVFDRQSRAEHVAQVRALQPDEAEALARHEAAEDHPAGHFYVKVVGLSARRTLWSVWLRGRRGLREALPAEEPLLLGRVVAADVACARAEALAAFAGPGPVEPGAKPWRWLQRGDHFVVTQC